MKKYTLYVLTNRENGKRYVGVTTDFERRLSQHRRPESAIKNALVEAIREHGWDSFEVSSTTALMTDDEAYSHETALIEKLQTHISQNGYNTCWSHRNQDDRDRNRVRAKSLVNRTRRCQSCGEADHYDAAIDRGLCPDCRTLKDTALDLGITWGDYATNANWAGKIPTRKDSTRVAYFAGYDPNDS